MKDTVSVSRFTALFITRSRAEKEKDSDTQAQADFEINTIKI